MIVRKVEPKDLKQVVDIQVRGWQTAYRGIIDDEYLDSMNVENRIEKRQNDYLMNNFIVAEEDGKIVGFCRYNDDVSYEKYKKVDSEIYALYVKPELKRTGIGRKMMEYVFDDLKNKKKTKMILWCLKENYPSRKFYEKMGGILTGEKDILIGDKNYEEVGFIYEL